MLWGMMVYVFTCSVQRPREVNSYQLEARQGYMAKPYPQNQSPNKTKHGFLDAIKILNTVFLATGHWRGTRASEGSGTGKQNHMLVQKHTYECEESKETCCFNLSRQNSVVKTNGQQTNRHHS